MLRRSRNLVRELAAPSILRLSLGRRATPDERRLFNFGFTDQHARMPPLLFGLLSVPDWRSALLHSAERAWHRNRALEKGRPAGDFSELDGNIFAAWTGPPLSFLHIEKCGGCALISWLARHFHPHQINSDPVRDLAPHLFSRLTPRSIPQPLIWGHYDLPTLRRFDPYRAAFTLLREPRARLVSLYHFWRSVDPARIDPEMSFAVAYAHRLSLADFLNHDDPCLTDSIDNVYVRRLTGLYATGETPDRLKLAPNKALAQAMAMLKSLLFVGITEELDRSAASLAARLNIPPPAQALRANVAEENHRDPSGWFRRVTRAPQSRAVQTALDRRTELDRELYAFAHRNFKQQPRDEKPEPLVQYSPATGHPPGSRDR